MTLFENNLDIQTDLFTRRRDVDLSYLTPRDFDKEPHIQTGVRMHPHENGGWRRALSGNGEPDDSAVISFIPNSQYTVEISTGMENYEEWLELIQVFFNTKNAKPRIIVKIRYEDDRDKDDKDRGFIFTDPTSENVQIPKWMMYKAKSMFRKAINPA